MTPYTYKTIVKILTLSCFIMTNAQVKVSTVLNESITPDPSTVLDLTASDRGFSMTTVSLASETDAQTINTPKKGLLVYHGGNNQMREGIYYNAGTSASPKWSRLSAISSLEGAPVVKNLGPYSETRTVELDHIEARLIENPSDGNKKQVQIRSTETIDLDYSVIAKQYWVPTGTGHRSTRSASGTMTSTFNWVADVDSLNNDNNELNDIWIYITTSGYEGTYRLIINTININSIAHTALILRKY